MGKNEIPAFFSVLAQAFRPPCNLWRLFEKLGNTPSECSGPTRLHHLSISDLQTDEIGTHLIPAGVLLFYQAIQKIDVTPAKTKHFASPHPALFILY